MVTSQTDIYIQAVLSGHTDALSEIISKNVRAHSPITQDVLTDIESICSGLALISKIVFELRVVRTYSAQEDWHAAVFHGTIDGEVVQFSDHLHLDDFGKIDRIEIFLRPSNIAELFYTRMSAFIA